MSSKKRNALIMLIIIGVLAISIIASLVFVIFFGGSGIDSIKIKGEFTETELDINGDYKISITSDPEGKDATDFDYFCDSTSATFTAFDENSAILHTSSEGSVDIYVTYKGTESNKLSFKIVDKAAQEAAQRQMEEQLAAEQAAAEAERAAAEAAEAEAAAANAVHVKVIKDSVNVRSEASTGSEAIGKAKKGDTFEVIEEVSASDGTWSKIKFGDKEGFIRNDLIEKTDGNTSSSEEKPKEEAKKKEENTQNNDTNNDNANADNNQTAGTPDAESQANAAAAEAAKNDNSEAALAQLLANATPAPAPAVSTTLPATGSGMSWSYQGTIFTPRECDHFHAKYDFTGDAAEAVTHHSAGELIEVLKFDGIRQ